MSAQEDSAPVATSSQKIILCIDDQHDGLVIRKIFLETFGYRVVLAGCGRDGLNVLEKQHVDAVLLDYRMAEMDGEAVAIEARKKWPDLPIIMLSGYVSEIPPRVHNLVNAFVSKGDPPTELLQTLQNVLGSLPMKPPARYFDYDSVHRHAQQQIERSRKLVAKNRDGLKANRERDRHR